VGPGDKLDRLDVLGVAGQPTVVDPVQPDDLGQQVRVGRIGLRPGGGVPLPVAGHLHRVDRVHLISGCDQRGDPWAAVCLGTDLHQPLGLSQLQFGPLLGHLVSDQRMQGGDSFDAFGQPPTRQHPALVVDQLDIVMVLGPVISHEQHCNSSPALSVDYSSAEETPSDLMVKCSPSSGARHPSSGSPPHDQRAHGLPQDLEGLMSGVLTRQPLPEPSLPKPPGESH
jgi:hypothetical protein